MAYIPSPSITTSISSKNKLKLSDLREDKEKVFNNSRTKFIRPPQVVKMPTEKKHELDIHLRREYLKNLGGVNKPAPNYFNDEVIFVLEKQR